MFGFCDLEDPETGEEYMLRRGECVNVLPGFFKKVWTYNYTCTLRWSLFLDYNAQNYFFPNIIMSYYLQTEF